MGRSSYRRIIGAGNDMCTGDNHIRGYKKARALIASGHNQFDCCSLQIAFIHLFFIPFGKRKIINETSVDEGYENPSGVTRIRKHRFHNAFLAWERAKYRYSSPRTGCRIDTFFRPRH